MYILYVVLIMIYFLQKLHLLYELLYWKEQAEHESKKSGNGNQ